MMTVMQWLAALAIVLGSLGAAVAHETGGPSPRARRYWFQTQARLPSRSVAVVPRRMLLEAPDIRGNLPSYPRPSPITDRYR